MTDQYADYEELRPIGEATHVPDDQLASGGEPRRQRSGSADAGYPDDPTAAATECVSCGASIPADQSKCRFCLTNHLDTAGDQELSDASWSLLHVVQMLVEASTFYGAVAKGSAAASLLTNSASDPTVDDCQLIYDLDEVPAPQLADQWPSLLSPTRVTSDCGDQLLAAACERTPWREAAQSCHDGEHSTFLYDETGSGIRADDRLASIREDANDDPWLVLAIALQESVAETSTEHSRHERANRTHLECQECDGIPSIGFVSSKPCLTANGPASPCGSASGVERPATGPTPKPVSSDGTS